MLSLTRTVRDIALEQPQATRVFEKLKIDYCCGGDKTVGEACASAGVEIASLERMLDESRQSDFEVNVSIDFQNLTLRELINHIIDKHHVYTKDEMLRLEPLMAKVISVHGGNHSELNEMGALFQQVCADLKPHMFKEEQILFPYVLEMERSVLENSPAPFAPFGTVKNPVRMMMLEHDTVGDLLRELRALSSNYVVPADSCISYQTLYQAMETFEQDLHQHIHLENNILFPRAVELESSLSPNVR
jgi:regulator of cell morphogenesis and NO signaling